MFKSVVIKNEEFKHFIQAPRLHSSGGQHSRPEPSTTTTPLVDQSRLGIDRPARGWTQPSAQGRGPSDHSELCPYQCNADIIPNPPGWKQDARIKS